MANTVNTVIKVDASEGMRAFKGLESAMTGASFKGTLLANVVSTGLSAAFDLLGNSVGAVTGLLGEAMEASGNAVLIAGDFAKITGLGYKEAAGYISGLTVGIANAVSELPGATSAYVALGTSIQDSLAGAFTGIDGSLDLTGLQEATIAIVESAALRADSLGIDADAAAMAMERFVSGDASWKQVKQLDIFQKSPAVVSFVEDRLESMGKELEDLSELEMVTLLQEAFVVDSDALDVLRDKTAGLIEGFRSSLLDPNVGLLGLNRILSSGGTAMEAVDRMAKAVFGDGGLVSAIGSALSSLGLSGDPMERLSLGIGKLTDFIGRVSKAMTGIDLSTFDFAGAISKGINSLVTGLANFALDTSLDTKLGQVFAALFNGIGQVVLGIDLTEVGRLALNVGFAAIQALGAVITNIDWFQLGQLLTKAALVAVLGLGATVAPAILGISAPVLAVIVGVTSATVGVFQKLLGPIGGIYSSSSEAIQNIGKALRDALQAVGNYIKNSLNNIRFGDGNVAPGVPNSAGSNRGRVPNAATGFNVGGLLSAAQSESAAMPAGAQIVVANSSEAILNRAQQAALATGRSLVLNGGITIHAGATSDPQALANKVMSELERRWSRHSSGMMTTRFS